MSVILTQLTGQKRGTRDEIKADRITIGRATDNVYRFSDDQRRVSSHHAEIRLNGDRWILFDLGSTNGTMINGRRVVTSDLNHDDLVEFGAGGPLIRFSIKEQEKASDSPNLRDTLPPGGIPAIQGIGETTMEMIVDRAVKKRTGNVGLISAILLAMIAGAAGGFVLSSRTGAAVNPIENPQLTFAAVAQRNSSAVVFIRTEFDLVDASGRVQSSEVRTGTGFVVSPSGLILTNRHLIHDWEYDPPPPNVTGRIKKIEVTFPGDTRQESISAVVHRLSSDVSVDLAVIKVNPGSEMAFIKLRPNNFVQVDQGDEVAVLGYPLGLDLMQLTGEEKIEPSLFAGVVSHSGNDYLQLSLRAYNGNSGGPVLNLRGEVIGILTANVGEAEDITLCTPVSAARDLVEYEGLL